MFCILHSSVASQNKYPLATMLVLEGVTADRQRQPGASNLVFKPKKMVPSYALSIPPVMEGGSQ